MGASCHPCLRINEDTIQYNNREFEFNFKLKVMLCACAAEIAWNQPIE